MLFIGIHLLGVGEALKVTFVITAIALAGLLLFALGAIGSFDTANLTDIPPGDAVGASPFLPFGLVGVWASFPFAIWFFLAVEGVPLAAEEARDPVRAVPRGIIVAMGVLAVSAAAVLFLAPGAQGSLGLSTSDNPLVSALEAGSGGSTWLSTTVNYIGLLGLIASFFSIIYAYSRQTFALSRAGYLPRVLSRTNGRKAPTLALIVPGAIGFVLAATGNGDILINLAVFGATLSYVLMMVAHQVLRVRNPDMPRPYRTPGGRITTGVALVLALAAVVATFLVDVVAALCALGAFAALHGLLRVLLTPPPRRVGAGRGVRGTGEGRRGDRMSWTTTLGGHSYGFADLRELLAKATPARSGDVLAGVAAESAAERVAAQTVLADLPLAHFLDEAVVPYEDDDVTRLILDSHDAAAFAPVAVADRRRLPGLAAVLGGRHHRAERPRARAHARDGGGGQQAHARRRPGRRRPQDPRRHGPAHDDRPRGAAGDAPAAQPPDRRPRRHHRVAGGRAAARRRRRGGRASTPPPTGRPRCARCSS